MGVYPETLTAVHNGSTSIVTVTDVNGVVIHPLSMVADIIHVYNNGIICSADGYITVSARTELRDHGHYTITYVQEINGEPRACTFHASRIMRAESVERGMNYIFHCEIGQFSGDWRSIHD